MASPATAPVPARTTKKPWKQSSGRATRLVPLTRRKTQASGVQGDRKSPTSPTSKTVPSLVVGSSAAEARFTEGGLYSKMHTKTWPPSPR